VELGSVVGVVLVLLGTIVALILKGLSPMYLFSIPAAIMIVIVCATGATMLSFKMKDTTGVFKAIMKVFLPGAEIDKADGIRTIVDFAGKARRDGILALEAEIGKVEEPFLKKGLQMAIDGVDPEAVEEVLRTDIKAMKARHKIGSDWCMTMGVFSPTFGIIGAVFGLIATMSHLNDVKLLAQGISAAFVATFWGVFMANGLMLPFSNKLKRYSGDETQYREMLLEGVLAIQAGKNPRVVEETLLSYLPPADREGFSSGGA